MTENFPISSSELKVLSTQIKYVTVSKRKQIKGNTNQIEIIFFNVFLFKVL